MKVLSTLEVNNILLIAAAGAPGRDGQIAHPSDIANAMVNAIEAAADTLVVLDTEGHLTWRRRS